MKQEHPLKDPAFAHTVQDNTEHLVPPAAEAQTGNGEDQGTVAIPSDPQSVDQVIAIDSHAAQSSSTADPPATVKIPGGPPLRPHAFKKAETAGGRFKVLRHHAKGGLGVVSVAEDTELHREVALKEIKKHHSTDPDSQARFMMEAEITGGLEHPGIVPVYSLGKYPDGRPYYAMRFIRGDTLAQSVVQFHHDAAQRDPGETAIKLRQLIARLITVCQAIEYAHSRGILHRDIKPSNIMLGKYGETLVVDWGIAKLMNQSEAAKPSKEEALRPQSASDTTETQMGMTVGTPQYMSPEQAAGQLDLLGPASDVYSLGATLYFILVGKSPFDSERGLESLKKVQIGDFPPPRYWNRKIPKAAEAICLKAMSLEPADRYQSPTALADDLEKWMADEPVTALRENAYERGMRWIRHHRSWAMAGAIALLLVTGVSIAATVLVDNARQQEVAARQESDRQRAMADESFMHARGAVNDFFTRVSEETLREVPGMQPFRQDLLQVALDYEQKFLEQRAKDPTLRRELAAAAFRVALVTGEIKSKAEALPLFERARAIQEELLKAEPRDEQLRYALSNTYNEIGRTRFVANRRDEALSWFEKSLALREELVKEFGDNAEYQRKLANTYMNLGTLAKLAGRLDDALRDNQRANEIREQLAAHDSAEPLFRRDLARGRYQEGLLAVEAQDLKRAVESLGQAADVYGRLADDYPLVMEYRQELGTCLRVMADLLVQSSEYDRARTALERARDLQQRLATENPHLVNLAAALAGTCNDLAGLHQRRNQPADALPLALKAVEVLAQLVKTNSEEARFRGDLAASLLRAGTLQLAIGDPPAALESFQEALANYTQLADAAPENLALQDELGKCLMNIGVVETRQGNSDAARKSLERARQIYDSLTGGDTEQAAFVANLTRCYINLGLAEEAAQQLDTAMNWFSKARESSQRLLERYDPSADSHALLAIAWNKRGTTLRQLKRLGDALAAHREAVEAHRHAFETQPDLYRSDFSVFLADLALVQRESGQAADSIATTLARKVLWPNQPAELYTIARELAQIAMSIGENPTEEQRKQQALAIEQAIAALGDAKRAGYRDWAAARSDEGLSILRNQESFLKLLPSETQ